MQRAAARKKQAIFCRLALALVLSGLLSLPDKLGHTALFDPVFMQVAGSVVDHIQPTIAQQTNTQGP
jgi:hypothetical protein